MATTPSVGIQSSGSAISNNSGLDLENLLPFILEKFVAVLMSALIVVVGIFLINIIKGYLRRLQVQHEQQKTALNLFEKLVTGFLVVIIITLALKNVGLDMTLLVSVSILGLSYGLQDIIKNYVAGILILFKSPFKIGEIIKIKDFTGRVEKIDFQSTTLRTFDRRNVTIYNSDVMTQAIVNFSNSSVRRIDLAVTLGYGTDTTQALQIFEQILARAEGILKNPAYRIVFKKFADNGVCFEIRAWVQMPANILQIKSDLAMKINQAFDEKGFYMPYTKDIQLEADYTLGESRDQQKSRLLQSLTIPAATLPQGLVPELIDFEEME